MTPVVVFPAVDRSAIAEEPSWVAVSAMTEILDVANACPGKPRSDVAGEIEKCMICARCRREKSLIGLALNFEGGDELRADFIVRLPDHRSECRHYASALGTTALHGGDRRFDHPLGSASLTRMRGSHNPCAGVR